MTSDLQSILLRTLDQSLQAKQTIQAEISPPSKGWLRAVREALNRRQHSVAKKMGIRQQAYANVEKREEDETISLSTLKRAANALDCDLVYFLLPKKQTARSFAELAANTGTSTEHLRATEHSMSLEGQAIGDLPPAPPPTDNKSGE